MQRGFEHQYGHYGALVDYWLHSRGGVYDWHRNEQPIDEDGYSTYLIADEAVRLIESQNGERPFFLYVPFNAVHSPYAKQAPPELIAKYQGTGVNPDQAAQVEAMDIAIGRILEALDAKGLGDDTLVWFFNDNGGTGVVKQNGPYRDFKCAYFEGGIRVASVVRWPGKIPANSTSDEMLHCVDMYPTLIRLAGGSLEQPLPLDGLDAWATIAEGAPSPRQEILHGPDTIRVGDWKYIDGAAEYYSWKAGEDWLFNIREDPGETNNLLAAFPEKAEELRQRLAYWKTQERPAEEKDKIPGHPNWLFGEEENKTEPPAWLIERMTKARAGADATLNEGGEGAAPRERPRRANREERGGQ
ncbi:MAG: Arylsulfatase [candidate division BRC1 bacterium ADurb.BinA364]|nr:MAG: Arylsulfatase [candidate division BRC1 bacterium ADurb.BinA364]